MIDYLDLLDKKVLIWIHENCSNSVLNILMTAYLNTKDTFLRLFSTLIYSSVFLYVITPLIMGISTRKILMNKNHSSLKKFSNKIEPFSIIGLLFTVILLFAFQGETIIAKPIIILLIAIPLILQSYGIFIIAYLWSYLWKLPHNIAAPASLIGTSNFFELAVAVAISIFGLNSGAALATVVGVLVEVPVMLTLVAIANKTKHKFQN